MSDQCLSEIVLGCVLYTAFVFLVIVKFSDSCQNYYLVSRGLAEYYLDKDHKRQWRLIIDRPKDNQLNETY